MSERQVHVEVLAKLDADETDAVTLLAERATENDGVRPLSEHVALHLRHGGDEGVRHLLAYGDGRGAMPHLAGYAHLDVTDEVAGSSAEVVVDPAWRRNGIGRLLVDAVRAETPDGRLRLWAHGESPAASGLATSLGFGKTRELLQLRRSLSAPIPPAEVPAGITLRTFTPGADDEAWTALNALIFADHPEQGGWRSTTCTGGWPSPGSTPPASSSPTGTETWSATTGRRCTAAGRSCTSTTTTARTPTRPTATRRSARSTWSVHPSERGTGLGTALILTGLHHLRSAGLLEAMLYVDADNPAAIAAYRRLGFTWTPTSSSGHQPEWPRPAT